LGVDELVVAALQRAGALVDGVQVVRLGAGPLEHACVCHSAARRGHEVERLIWVERGASVAAEGA
jgi:hypothetical protein